MITRYDAANVTSDMFVPEVMLIALLGVNKSPVISLIFNYACTYTATGLTEVRCTHFKNNEDSIVGA